MTVKHSELFLKCWEHNLDWDENLLKEHFFTKGRGKGYAARLVFSYGIRQGKKLIRRCRDEYEYDLPAMIKDMKEDGINLASLPIRFIHHLIRPEAN